MRHRESLAWEVAGLVTDQGTLDRPVAVSKLIVPDPATMVIKDGLLIWSLDHLLHAKWPDGTVLTEFIKLADAPDAAILKYAQQWGVLRICKKHGLPSSHNQPSGYDVNEPPGCSLVLSRDPEGWAEPLAKWRGFARLARALLNIAAQLHQGQPGQDKDWQAVYDTLGVEESARKQRTRDRQAKDLSQIVNSWLYLGGVKPWFDWESKPSVTLSGHWLFGQLATQLMLAVSASKGLLFCKDCGVPFASRPHQSSRRGPYCADCGRHGAMRAASKQYYAKNREKIGSKRRETYRERNPGTQPDAKVDSQS